MRPTTQLRHLLQGERLVVAPFAYDAMQAKIIEQTGFPAVYMTGFGTAAARGYPDVGLVTMSEMVQNASYIASAVSVPVIADADTGYGNPLNVRRTVREYEKAGVAAIHIEDQVWPKKCGFMEGKRVIPRQEMAQKIRAALDARLDPDFVIIARTDALAVHGMEETLERCRLYRQAGADLIFVDGLRTREQIETVAKSLRGIPLLYNGGYVSVQEAEALGYKVMITAGTIFAVYRCVRDLMQELKATGRTWTWQQRDQLFKEFTDFIGLPEIYDAERRYGVV
jgi:2-methylisocitrate lyase-like PEP mutase family enzyme